MNFVLISALLGKDDTSISMPWVSWACMSIVYPFVEMGVTKQSRDASPILFCCDSFYRDMGTQTILHTLKSKYWCNATLKIKVSILWYIDDSLTIKQYYQRIL